MDFSHVSFTSLLSRCNCGRLLWAIRSFLYDLAHVHQVQARGLDGAFLVGLHVKSGMDSLTDLINNVGMFSPLEQME